jgi:sorbose reductase
MATPDQIGEFIAVMLSEKQGGMGFMAGSDVVLDGGSSKSSSDRD